MRGDEVLSQKIGFQNDVPIQVDGIRDPEQDRLLAEQAGEHRLVWRTFITRPQKDGRRTHDPSVGAGAGLWAGAVMRITVGSSSCEAEKEQPTKSAERSKGGSRVEGPEKTSCAEFGDGPYPSSQAHHIGRQCASVLW